MSGAENTFFSGPAREKVVASMEDDALTALFDTLVAGGASPEAAASQLRQIAPDKGQAIDAIWAGFEVRAGIIRYSTDPAALVSRTTVGPAWYTGPKSNDVHWPAVRARLSKILPATALESIDVASSKVLALVHAPGEPTFETRGLVLGNVQSGKTTSFISVISKAADRGFRIFIVLSGVTDNLRSQTQQRVDDLLVGDDSKSWFQLTSAEADFSESPANAAAVLNSGLKLIAVVKKNPARLRRLNAWLNAVGAGAMSKAPMILIDDEADQASIDVGKKRTSVINGLMRDVLARPKAAYVAYTATPFANLLIDPSDSTDLYPRHFVVSLPISEDYFGAERIFGRVELLSVDDQMSDGLDLVRDVSDLEAASARPPAKAIATWQSEVGEALAEAIRWFLLASAARRVRGQGGSHSTMLVHTSMLAAAHERTAEGIEAFLDELSGWVEHADEATINQLREQYEDELGRVPAHQFDREPVGFSELLEHLPNVLADVKLVVDNYRSTDRLSYSPDSPTTTIVVGGNTLSRGLTLEGLSSSYFVRSASTYDTLLQMGRWFGYRVGYEDLCRIWMTQELATWFRDLSLVEAEIRSEIKRYEYEGVTPEQVGVRIRQHPAMAITAAVKSRSAVRAQMSYSGERPQTILFRREDEQWLKHNVEAVRKLVGRASRVLPEEEVRGRIAFKGVDAIDVTNFLEEYAFHENSQSVRSELLIKYIRSEMKAGSLRSWNVVVMSGPVDEGGIDLGLKRPVGMLNRSRLLTLDTSVANMKAIASTPDRIADIGLEELKAMLGDARVPTTDIGLLNLREANLGPVGLLCIYPIDPRSTVSRAGDRKGVPRVDMDAVAPVVGVAAFFPRALSEESLVTYVTAATNEQMFESLEDELHQIEAADSADELVAETAS